MQAGRSTSMGSGSRNLDGPIANEACNAKKRIAQKINDSHL